LNGVSEKKRKKYIKQNGKMKGLEANEIERWMKDFKLKSQLLQGMERF
jgi:hypothetical protein